MKHVVALLTDFGLRDNYVGVMKAVMLGINHQVKFIDISHDLAAQDIPQAAFMLANSIKYFPHGTVFLAVVDPGVGSSRKPIAIQTKNFYFVGPDNGLLNLAAAADAMRQCILLENKEYFLPSICATFQARDIFAPCAANLAKGIPLAKFGRPIKKIHTLAVRAPIVTKNRLVGKIMQRDRFGNLITDIPLSVAAPFLKVRFSAQLNRRIIKDYYHYYEQAPAGVPFFIAGSFGYLEISLKYQDASSYFGIPDAARPRIIIQRQR